MDNVNVRFTYNTVITHEITGFLKELKIKLDRDSTTTNPVVKEFELNMKGMTTTSDTKNDIVTSVRVEVPETVIVALAGQEYEEEIKDGPKAVNGHTEAEAERDSDVTSEIADISSLMDDNNDQLKERKGPCNISSAQ